MKEKWWRDKATELQEAADSHDMKRFYDGLKSVYGPKASGSVPVRSLDGTTLITDRRQILHRWAEHFQSVLNLLTAFYDSVLDEIPQLAPASQLDDPRHYKR